jgi:hypothetical protein
VQNPNIITAARAEVHKTERVNDLSDKLAKVEQERAEKWELDKVARRN